MTMFNNMQLNDTEIGIFGAIILLQSGTDALHLPKIALR